MLIGIDDAARWTLLLISEYPPMKVTSSRMILVKSGRRPDKKWSLSFSLVDDSYSDMFVLFCEDIIYSSACITSKEKAARFVGKRYKEWREMLANTHGSLLSPKEVKGLLGEMYFLKFFLCARYGAKEAVLSWTGPKHLPQDYIIDDTWYEVILNEPSMFFAYNNGIAATAYAVEVETGSGCTYITKCGYPF